MTVYCVGNVYEKSTDAKTDDANDGEVHRNEMAKNTLYIAIVPGQSQTHQIIFWRILIMNLSI